jgi:hypothetical protein
MKFHQARSKMKERPARVKVLKARRKETKIIAMEMGTMRLLVGGI